VRGWGMRFGTNQLIRRILLLTGQGNVDFRQLFGKTETEENPIRRDGTGLVWADGIPEDDTRTMVKREVASTSLQQATMGLPKYMANGSSPGNCNRSQRPIT
jgi:hypothetical protein